MNIAIALNRKVIPQTCVFLRSLSLNHPGMAVCVYVLHSELEIEDEDILGSVFLLDKQKRIEFVSINRNRLPYDLPTNVYWSIEMYYRLMLPDILPQAVDRILYLDIDMIVNKNLIDFYNIEFGDKLLVVSRDQEFERLVEEEKDIHPKRFEVFSDLMDRGMVYFCSGMILFNISAMRERYTFDYYMERFREISDWAVLPDQDLLNFVHWQDTIYVDEGVYGLFSQTAHECGVTYEEVKAGSAIIHFTGRAKPWTVNLIRYDIERLWWEYAKDTPYYHALLEQVFYQWVDSTLVEDTVNKLSAENEELKKLLLRMQDVMTQIGGFNG